MARGLPEMFLIDSKVQANSMKIFSRLALTLSVGVIAATSACGNSKKETQPTAAAPEDTMLLHDLAEANKNTANAAALDNSLTSLRSSQDSQPSGAAGAAGSSQTPQTHVVSRPAATPGETSVPAATAMNQSTPTTTRVRTDTRSTDTNRTTASRQGDRPSSAPSSSGDPCDSPAAADQRTCLNRYIAANDADLNQTYQDLIAQSRKSGGPELEERLREAQRAWVNDRDMACRRSGDNANGLWARPVARCLADYSSKRTVELRHTLSSLRGQQ